MRDMAARKPRPRIDVILPELEPEKARIYLDASTVELVKKLARFARVELSAFVEQAAVAWVQVHHPELSIVHAGESVLAGDLAAASRAGGILRGSGASEPSGEATASPRKKPARRGR